MVLRCVCFHCSRLMADPSDYRVQAAQKLKSQRRLEAMHALCRTQKRCEFATKEELDAHSAGLKAQKLALWKKKVEGDADAEEADDQELELPSELRGPRFDGRPRRRL